MKKLIYFMIFTSFFGAQFLNFTVGSVQMSLFRGSVILAIIYFFLKAINEKKLVLVLCKQNRYSILFHMFWLIYGMFTLIWVRDVAGWIRATFFLGIGVFTTIIFSQVILDEKDIKNAFIALKLGIIMQSAIGWYEVFSRNYYFVAEYVGFRYSIGDFRIPIAMCGNPNDFALLMLLGVFIFCTCLKNNKYMKLLNFVCSINCLILLLLTQSRANVLGLIIGCIYMFYKKRHKALILTICVIFSIAVLPQLLNYLQSFLSFNFNSTYMGSDKVRVNLIKNGLLFLASTFGLGTGSGQIEYWMANKGVFPTGGITNIHNWWAELLTAYGIFVFIGYLIYFCKLFLNMHSVQRTQGNDEGKAISLCIASCMVAFLLGGVSSSSNIGKEWLWCFWSIAITYQGIIGRMDQKIPQS